VHVIGTAGHVDHGKSTLVRSLTGTDPDRWLEERLRGMTLDLCFARLQFEDGLEAGIVDVPGHERFLHNMLAGAAGMELLLLVVAANDGPRPQTLEHLAILEYLNVQRTIVVLSKADAVSNEEREFAIELVREATRGTKAHDAPVVAVSALTGFGLPELRASIHAALSELPARAPERPSYLPIDRVFSLPGLGTIVTGTLMQGEIALGDRLWLTPLEREVRVRSLQIFGEKRERVAGGSRVAANLVGVDTSEIRRGAVLAAPQFASASSFDVRFSPHAPNLDVLRRRTPVRAYVGAAEILGTLVFESLPSSSEPVAARLHLRAPTVALPGAAFVVRRLSPKDLLGGGTFTGAAAPVATLLDEAPDLAAICEALDAAGSDGTTPAKAGARANVREQRALELLEQLRAEGRALHLSKPSSYVASEQIEMLERRVRERVEASQSAAPWLLGMTALGLARALAMPEAALLRILNALAEDGRLAHRAGYFATPDFVPSVTAEQRNFFETAFARDPGQPFVPLAASELHAKMAASKITGLAQSLETLFASGALVKVGSDVYRGEQLTEIRGRLEDALRRSPSITPAEFRDLLDTSRKFAVPLLEWFDAAGVTLRSGDARVLRKAAPKDAL
jgi:selenocysteine-specific elongation factor